MCVSVLTHTSPCPPPGAGVALVAAAVVARVAGAGLAAAGLAAVSVLAFLRERGFFGDGDAAGDSAVEGDAAGDSPGVGD